MARLSRPAKILLGWVLGLSALAVVIAVAVASMNSNPDMDRRSYEMGYDAFGGAYLARGETDDRDTDRAYCAEFWTEQEGQDLAGVVQRDWIEGCADAREGKDSQFK